MKIPNYPNEFYYIDRDRHVSEEEINEMVNTEIKRMIDEMEKLNRDNLSSTFQDVLIFVDRLKDDSGCKYEISVTENHKSAFVR